MALFGFGKKEKEEKAASCGCSCSCSASDKQSPAPAKNEGAGETGSIKVLGTGCASCHALLENTKKAAAEMGLESQVEYVTDMVRIAGYGVMRLPALVVDGAVAASGKVLKPDEITALLHKARD